MRYRTTVSLAAMLISLPIHADTQSPTIPGGVTASANSTSQVDLRWNAASDNTRVAGYNIYRNGLYHSTVFDTDYTDTSVSQGNGYRYSVTAFDDARNYSLASSAVSISVPSAGVGDVAADRVDGAPTAPSGLSASIQSVSSARLQWAEVGGSVAGYNVYRDNSYRTTVWEAQYTDTTMTPGQDYRYSITSFTAGGQYSTASDTLLVNTGSSNVTEVNTTADETVASPESAPADDAPAPTGGVPSGYSLVFSDEFNQSSLDTSKWNSRYRWGPDWIINNEAQYYVDQLGNPDFGHQPFTFDGSTLTITAIPTPDYLRGSASNQAFLSGALTTFNKFRMRYGYVEMRARLPRGKGLWPAFWLLHQNNDGTRPEIDVMEFLGDRPNTIYNTYHFYANNTALQSTPTYEFSGPDFSAGFHTYGMKWEPGSIVWYVDGVEVNHYESGNVSSEDMYLLVNLALGGSWAGYPDGSTSFPARYSIDYIRAYQR